MARDGLGEWLSAVDAARAFRALASLAGDAMPGAAWFVVDARRDVVVWPPEAEALLGWPAAEVLGRHCLSGVRCAACLSGCGLSEHGALDDVPRTLRRADGSDVRVRARGAALHDSAGRFVGGIEWLLPDAAEPVRVTAPSRGVPVADVPAAALDPVRFHGIVTCDPSMVRAVQTVRNVAETDATVLVRGESGTGKELVARAIHAESARAGGPFVAVNCAAFTPSLLESELFGHVRGAFTGATQDRPGIFVQAHGGTLFLDEVGELPLELQSKLLRVLQERVVTPVGGTRAVPVDVRVVAATHRALREEVRAGRFREDLMYRLRVVPVFLPALRERPRDIPLLLQAFIDAASRTGPRRVTSVAPPAMRVLLDHAWPGNVRELQNVVAYAFAVGRSPVLDVDDLPPEFREVGGGGGHPPPQRLPRTGARAARLRAALAAHPEDTAAAAAALGISRTTLWRWRRELEGDDR
jgi:transcriptional regulator with PAS, ATPase and Fis domain